MKILDVFWFLNKIQATDVQKNVKMFYIVFLLFYFFKISFNFNL
jgi:hypothetical protein